MCYDRNSSKKSWIFISSAYLFLKSSGNTPATDDMLTPTFSNKLPFKYY